MINFIRDSKNFVKVLISSNKYFLHAIRINLKARHTALYGLYRILINSQYKAVWWIPKLMNTYKKTFIVAFRPIIDVGCLFDD